MNIYIIRHAEPDYARDSLTEKGWREAELFSHRLSKIPNAFYYTSPLGRAQRHRVPDAQGRRSGGGGPAVAARIRHGLYGTRPVYQSQGLRLGLSTEDLDA